MLDNHLDIVEAVHAANPGLILNPHAFTNAVAYELWKKNPNWGHNIKRGTQGLSEDAICKLDNDSPLTVKVGTSPNNGRGIYVVDIISSAGTSRAAPMWLDQTRATLNKGDTADWSRPIAIETGVKPPVEVPPTSCDCTCNFDDTLVREDISELRDRVEELAAHFDNTVARLTEMVGQLQARKTCRFL